MAQQAIFDALSTLVATEHLIGIQRYASEDLFGGGGLAGIIGALTGVVGTLQALEVIKLITGIGEPLLGRLLLYDALAARFDTIRYGGKA